MFNRAAKDEGDMDFVLTWVDGDDPAWQKERERFAPGENEDGRAQRYRDLGLLRYWFRGVERFAPWVRYVHFVTWGHLPKWLNPEAPKIRIVRHCDYMPHEALPTFSSHALEVNLHRIPGLSERFVYFNDDVFLLGPVKKTDFFVNGKPKEVMAFQPARALADSPAYSQMMLNVALLIGKYFNKGDSIRRHWFKFFHPGFPAKLLVMSLFNLPFPEYTGFFNAHGPAPLMKKTFKEIWELEGDYLSKMSRNRFRNGGDVCQFIFREWEKQKGNFAPCNHQRLFQYLSLDKMGERELRLITKRKKRIVCVNDTADDAAFEKARIELAHAFEAALPGKSSYEI